MATTTPEPYIFPELERMHDQMTSMQNRLIDAGARSQQHPLYGTLRSLNETIIQLQNAIASDFAPATDLPIYLGSLYMHPRQFDPDTGKRDSVRVLCLRRGMVYFGTERNGVRPKKSDGYTTYRDFSARFLPLIG
jgi:hypothetical protein